MVYVSEIVLYRDCLKLAYLKALATSDTSVGASLTCHASLVLIDTADVETASLGTLLAELDDHLRTSLDTRSTGGTLIFVHLGKACLRIHVDGIKVAHSDTVAIAQTAVTTARLATVQSRLDLTALSSYISIDSWTRLTGTITAHDGYERVALSDALTEDLCHLGHDRLSAYGAPEPFERGGFAASLSKAGTARMATATAVGLRKDLRDLADARIFFYFKLLGGDKK